MMKTKDGRERVEGIIRRKRESSGVLDGGQRMIDGPGMYRTTATGGENETWEKNHQGGGGKIYSNEKAMNEGVFDMEW
jgi:hypothetical protein